MKINFSPCRLVSVAMAGVALLSSCDKQEVPAPVSPAPVPAPTSAGTAVPLTPETAPGSAPPAALAPSAQEAAIAAFKAEVESIKAFMEANQASPSEEVALANVKELIKRAGTVKTDGLPEDLATAYQEMNRVMQRVQTSMNDLPVPIQNLPNYLKDEKAKGAAAEAEAQARVEAFKTTSTQLQKEGEAASAKLKEAGAKYGISSLDLGGP